MIEKNSETGRPFELDWLRREGFEGFYSIDEIRKSRAQIPAGAGNYMVVYNGSPLPVFMETGTAGFFKGKNPNVAIEVLHAKWAMGAKLLYVGKAGGPGLKTGLKERIECYLSFGAGTGAGHYGGRYIWQLEKPGELIVCWRNAIDGELPRMTELHYISVFISHFGKMPFANLK